MAFPSFMYFYNILNEILRKNYLLCILVLGASLFNLSMPILDWVGLSYCTILVVALAAKLSSRLSRDRSWLTRWAKSAEHSPCSYFRTRDLSCSNAEVWGVHIPVCSIVIGKPKMSHHRCSNFSQILWNIQGKSLLIFTISLPSSGLKNKASNKSAKAVLSFQRVSRLAYSLILKIGDSNVALMLNYVALEPRRPYSSEASTMKSAALNNMRNIQTLLLIMHSLRSLN
jgi:hypothetical protein